MKIGYARVSTEDQSLDAQRDQLRADGCARIFEEKMSGRKGQRPALDQALAALKPGDTLVVWKLDRLGRSLKNLAVLLHDLEGKGVSFRSLSDSIDTGTPTGKLLFHMLGAIAEFEAALISERTMLGMMAARRRGKRFGRPRMVDPQMLRRARALAERENLSQAEIALRLRVSRTTLWRAMNAAAGTHRQAPQVPSTDVRREP